MEKLRKAKLIGVAIVAIYAVIVIALNTKTIEVNLLFAKFETANAVLVIITLLIGIVLGGLLAGTFIYGKKKP